MLKSDVQFIPSIEAVDLRMRILRPYHPREACVYAEDDFETTFHLGIRFEKKIISNGTFMQQGHKHFPQAKYPYRLRGMATDKDFQKNGLGQQIILFAEAELKKRGCDLLWFNARVSAEAFYLKLGYVAIEEIFEIDTVGPHKVMYKWLENKTVIDGQ